jgi:hypothetical protein
MEIVGRFPARLRGGDDASWADAEFADADLGDRRLNRRVVRIARSLAAAPKESIPTASDGLAETIAVYRFLDNEKVTLQKVLKPHVERTHRRMRKHRAVLVAQDTTELDYTGCRNRNRDTGPLSRPRQRGFYLHPSIAFTPEGVCLGTLDAKIWARDDETFGTSRATIKSKPIEQKESYRWIEGWGVVVRAARACPETQVIGVSDRESDIHALLRKATNDPTPNARFVIRQRDDRSLPDRVTDRSSRGYKKVSSVFPGATVLGTITVQTTRSEEAESRLATVEIRSASVTLKSPRLRRRDAETEITVGVVWAVEREPPQGVSGIEWILFTDLPFATLDEAVQVVEYYAGRWGIEVFFRVLKSGCEVEELQLETRNRLEPCLGLYLIVAWRVLHLVMMGRQCPNLPCNVLLTASEWQSAWTIRKHTSPPEKTPPLGEMIAIIGSFGCHLGRKSDGPPGPKAIWTGLRRVMDFALAWNTFGPKPNPVHPPDG